MEPKVKAIHDIFIVNRGIWTIWKRHEYGCLVQAKRRLQKFTYSTHLHLSKHTPPAIICPSILKGFHSLSSQYISPTWLIFLGTQGKQKIHGRNLSKGAKPSIFQAFFLGGIPEPVVSEELLTFWICLLIYIANLTSILYNTIIRL